MARKSTGLLLWLGIAVIVVLLDQVSKITMSRLLVYGQSEMITPYFNLVMVYNQGAAFSFLASFKGLPLGGGRLLKKPGFRVC
jgi:signal peptidase II